MRLSELEAIVGSLKVDFGGREGMGHLSRPTLEETVANASSLPAGLVGVSVNAWFDIHHEEPKRPRDLRFRSVVYRFDATPSDLARVIESVHETPRVIDHGGMCFEYTAGHRGLLYLPIADTPAAQLEWHETRPDWAYPRVPDDARRTLLAHLIAALTVSDTPEQVAARVRSAIAAGGAAIDTYGDTVWLKLNPSLPLAVVLQAFGWADPLAYSGDVHQQQWTVIPAETLRRNAGDPTIGRWRVDVRLTGRPVDAAERGYLGPSPLYDLGESRSTPTASPSVARSTGDESSSSGRLARGIRLQERLERADAGCDVVIVDAERCA